MQTLKTLFQLIGIVGLFYIMLASIVWQFNNPIANESTFYTHFISVITMKKLPEFQTVDRFKGQPIAADLKAE